MLYNCIALCYTLDKLKEGGNNMKKQQFNVRISPNYIIFVNRVIQNEEKKGFVVSQADVVQDALKFYANHYRENNLTSDPLELKEGSKNHV